MVQSEKTSTDQLDKNAASTSATAPAYKKKASLRKSVYRAAKSTPQERRKYADVITRMVEKSIPKTKKVLQERVTVSPSSKKKLDFMSTSFANLKKQNKKKHGQPEKEEKQALRIRRTLAYSAGRKSKASTLCNTAQNSVYYRVQVAETRQKEFPLLQNWMLKKRGKMRFQMTSSR